MQKAEKAIVTTETKSLREKLEQPITPEIVEQMKKHLDAIDALTTRTAPLNSPKKIERPATWGFYTGK